MEKYRIVEGYGPYMNLRFEVQKKYFYFDLDRNMKWSWRIVYHSTKYEDCEKVLEKYLGIPSLKFDGLYF